MSTLVKICEGLIIWFVATLAVVIVYCLFVEAKVKLRRFKNIQAKEQDSRVLYVNEKGELIERQIVSI